MTVRALRCALFLLGLALVGGAVGASGASATPGHWETYSYVVGDASFVRMGRVPGQPGNAHSGNASFDTSDDPVVGYLYDWSCPADGRPVRFWNTAGPEYNDTTCTLLRSRFFDGSQGTQQMPDLVGALGASFADTVPFYDDYPTYDGTQADGFVRLRWTRSGPITRTVTRTDVDRTVLLSAPMRVTGRIGWVRLGDPRVETSVETFFRETYVYRVQ